MPRALPYQAGHFIGAARRSGVPMFIPTPELAVREMKRVVRSGGTIAVRALGFSRRSYLPTHALGYGVGNRSGGVRYP